MWAHYDRGALLTALIDTRAALREMLAIIHSKEIVSVCQIAAIHGLPFPEDVAAVNMLAVENARRVLGEA